MVPHDCFSCAIRPRWVYTVRVGIQSYLLRPERRVPTSHTCTYISVPEEDYDR